MRSFITGSRVGGLQAAAARDARHAAVTGRRSAAPTRRARRATAVKERARIAAEAARRARVKVARATLAPVRGWGGFASRADGARTRQHAGRRHRPTTLAGSGSRIAPRDDAAENAEVAVPSGRG